MKYVLKILFMLAVASILQTHGSSAMAATKAESVALTLKVVNKVFELSGQPSNSENMKAFDEKFMPVLQEVHDAATLAKIAVVCNNLAFPGTAGDQSTDDYFFSCLESSIWEIAKIEGSAAEKALQDFSHQVRLDGHLSETWKEAVAEQKKLTDRK